MRGGGGCYRRAEPLSGDRPVAGNRVFVQRQSNEAAERRVTVKAGLLAFWGGCTNLLTFSLPDDPKRMKQNLEVEQQGEIF